MATKTAIKKRILPAGMYAAVVDLPGSQEYYQEMLDCMEIHARKTQDYTGDRDPFFNFFLASALSGITVRQSFNSELAKKYTRMIVLKPGVEAQNESRRDTLRDMANYLMLQAACEEKYPHLMDIVLTPATVAEEFGQTVEQYAADNEIE